MADMPFTQVATPDDGGKPSVTVQVNIDHEHFREQVYNLLLNFAVWLLKDEAGEGREREIVDRYVTQASE